MRQKLTDRNNLVSFFLPKNHIHPFYIFHKTDENKVYHQENAKHSFDLSNGSNTRNGLEDTILMKELGSPSIQQKINKTHVSTTSEINNDNATRDHSNTTTYSNNSTE